MRYGTLSILNGLWIAGKLGHSVRSIKLNIILVHWSLIYVMVRAAVIVFHQDTLLCVIICISKKNRMMKFAKVLKPNENPPFLCVFNS